MLLAAFVVEGQIFLDGVCHQFIGDHQRFLRVHVGHKLKRVEQFARVASRESKQGLFLLDVDGARTQQLVFFQRAVDQRAHRIAVKALHHVHLAPAEEC